MAQKGTEAHVGNLETKRRKSSQLKSTTHPFRTRQIRGPHCYSEGWGQCQGRPALPSTTQPCRGP